MAVVAMALGFSLVVTEPAEAADGYSGYTLARARWVVVNKTNTARVAKGLNSHDHYANMMSPDANTIGVGMATSSNGTIYYTQNFEKYSKIPSPVTQGSFPSNTLGVTVKRVSGGDRYSAAVAISEASFSGTVPVAYVATGADYPDALAAADAINAPVVLVYGKKLDTTTGALLKSLKVKQVKIAGGTGVVNASTATALAKIGTVERFACSEAAAL